MKIIVLNKTVGSLGPVWERRWKILYYEVLQNLSISGCSVKKEMPTVARKFHSKPADIGRCITTRNKMKNYSEIQLRGTPTCEEEIEKQKRDLQSRGYSLHQFNSQHSRANQSSKHEEMPLAQVFVPCKKKCI